VNKMTKLIVAITGLLVAIGTLIGTISKTIGPDASTGIMIVLNSPEAYANFLANHPSSN